MSSSEHEETRTRSGGGGKAKRRKCDKPKDAALLASAAPSQRTVRIDQLEHDLITERQARRTLIWLLGALVVVLIVQLFLIMAMGVWAIRITQELSVAPVDDVDGERMLTDTDGRPLAVDVAQHIAPLSALLAMPVSAVHRVSAVRFQMAGDEAIHSMRVAVATVDPNSAWLVTLRGEGLSVLVAANGTAALDHDNDARTPPLLIHNAAELERRRRKRQLTSGSGSFQANSESFALKSVEGDLVCDGVCAGGGTIGGGDGDGAVSVNPCLFATNGGCDFACEWDGKEVSCDCDDQRDCNGRGKCSRDRSTCECDDRDWTGKGCSEPSVHQQQCSGRGEWRQWTFDESRSSLAKWQHGADPEGRSSIGRYVPDGMRCVCDDGFYGAACERATADLHADLCNGARGVPTVDEFCELVFELSDSVPDGRQVVCYQQVSCDCLPGFSGAFCEQECWGHGVLTFENSPTTSPLDGTPVPCDDAASGEYCYRCDCHGGWQGKQCENVRLRQRLALLGWRRVWRPLVPLQVAVSRSRLQRCV
eukprot:TRINITY_DN3593_c0_g1_i1.p1 TRINITY_DN3593_c0_g1~~TRINITY_DN3593_c0_g1_i1.p1  ORF type:complete len:535 (+),score=206.34 TRINITY_DN3593_c0_g1_i1:114-1718(+)